MTKATGPFGDLPPITDFVSCQRVRPLVKHRLGDLVGVWRMCEDKTCRRAKICRRGDGHCFALFVQAMPDTERRRFRYALENRCAGLDGDEACRRANARIDDEIARDVALHRDLGLDPCPPPSPSPTGHVGAADPGSLPEPTGWSPQGRPWRDARGEPLSCKERGRGEVLAPGHRGRDLPQRGDHRALSGDAAAGRMVTRC